MEDGTNIPKKFGWEQASWRDKGSKNAYKRGGGCHKKGDYEIQGRNHRIERERERESHVVFSFSCLFPIPQENNLYIIKNLILMPFGLVNRLSFPLWNLYHVSMIN